MKKENTFYCLWLMAALWACNSDKSESTQQADTLVVVSPEQSDSLVDSLQAAPEDGVTVTTPGDEPLPETSPAEQRPANQEQGTGKQEPASGKQPSPKRPQREQNKPGGGAHQSTTPPTESPAAIVPEGNYKLVRVQGDPLPLVLDMTTECDVKLLSGEMQLRKGQIQFQSITAEECAGQRKPHTKHEATGDYRVENNRIFINVTSGDALGDAVGVLEGSNIRLQQISNDAEQQEVDWLFQLQ